MRSSSMFSNVGTLLATGLLRIVVNPREKKKKWIAVSICICIPSMVIKESLQRITFVTHLGTPLKQHLLIFFF